MTESKGTATLFIILGAGGGGMVSDMIVENPRPFRSCGLAQEQQHQKSMRQAAPRTAPRATRPPAMATRVELPKGSVMEVVMGGCAGDGSSDGTECAFGDEGG